MAHREIKVALLFPLCNKQPGSNKDMHGDKKKKTYEVKAEEAG